MTEMPKKILVRAPNWIGDHIMAFPFYQGLRERYANADFTLVGKTNLEGLPFPGNFQKLIWTAKDDNHFPFGTWKMGRKVACDFDLGVSLAASYSSSLFLLAAGARARVGFAQGGSEVFLTTHIPWKGRQAKKHKSEIYLELLEWLGGDINQKFPSQESSEGNGIVIAPSASLPLREWPYYLELIQKLCRDYPHQVIRVVGSSADSKWHGFLKRINLPQVEDWVGKTSLGDLLPLFKKSSLVIANDSGSAHLAAMVGVPVLVIFGPGDPRYVQPLGKNIQIVRKTNLPCSPCERPYCAAPYGYQSCLKNLSVEEVLERVHSLLTVSL